MPRNTSLWFTHENFSSIATWQTVFLQKELTKMLNLVNLLFYAKLLIKPKPIIYLVISSFFHTNIKVYLVIFDYIFTICSNIIWALYIVQILLFQICLKCTLLGGSMGNKCYVFFFINYEFRIQWSLSNLTCTVREDLCRNRRGVG